MSQKTAGVSYRSHKVYSVALEPRTKAMQLRYYSKIRISCAISCCIWVYVILEGRNIFVYSVLIWHELIAQNHAVWFWWPIFGSVISIAQLDQILTFCATQTMVSMYIHIFTRFSIYHHYMYIYVYTHWYILTIASWQAFDVEQVKEVAVKVHQLNSGWSDAKKASYVKHATREFNIHKSLQHSKIVALVDIFELDNSSFATVLELCPNGDLDTHLKKHQASSSQSMKTNKTNLFDLLQCHTSRRVFPDI